MFYQSTIRSRALCPGHAYIGSRSFISPYLPEPKGDDLELWIQEVQKEGVQDTMSRDESATKPLDHQTRRCAVRDGGA
jgi:hypothetical protein